MSLDRNTELLERAGEVKTYYEGTDLELAIDKAIADNDLERLEFMVTEAEHDMVSQEEDFRLANEAFAASKLSTEVLRKELAERDESDVQ